MRTIKTNDKHCVLVHVEDDTLERAAIFVLDLAKRRGTIPSRAPGGR